MAGARDAMQQQVQQAEAAGAVSTPSDPSATTDGGAKSAEREAVERAAQGDPLTGAQEAGGTAWFLDPDVVEQSDVDVTHTFQVNIAPHGRPKRMEPYVVRPLDRDYIQQIRRAHTRREGAREITDDMGINLSIVVSATVSPDLRDPKVRGPYQDPADVLRLRLFRHKSGLIDQIANKVMSVSGYDDDDVLEVEAAKN